MSELIALRDDFMTFLSASHAEQTSLFVFLSSEGAWHACLARILEFDNQDIRFVSPGSAFASMNISLGFIQAIHAADKSKQPNVPLPPIPTEYEHGFYLTLRNNLHVEILQLSGAAE